MMRSASTPSGRRGRFSPLAVLAVLTLLASCSSGMFRQPEVTLQGVQLGGLGLRGGTLLVNLQVINPNRFSLSANKLDYELAIAGSEAPGDTSWVDFADGTYGERFTVEGHDTATVQIPVEFSYSGLGDAASSIFRNGTFAFRAKGAVDVKTPLGSYAVPFQKRGTVTLVGVR